MAAAVLESSFSALKKEQVKLLKAITETSEHPLTNNSAEISLISDRWRNPQSNTTTNNPKSSEQFPEQKPDNR
jgi:hypothetical protein